MDDPKLARQNTDTEDPRRDMRRTENEAPTHVKSTTETDDPSRGMPMTDNDAPTRAKARRDKDEPSCEKSNKDSVDPHRVIPRRARDEPLRAKLRSDKDAPMDAKSNTDNADPIRPVPQTESDEPRAQSFAMTACCQSIRSLRRTKRLPHGTPLVQTELLLYERKALETMRIQTMRNPEGTWRPLAGNIQTPPTTNQPLQNL